MGWRRALRIPFRDPPSDIKQLHPCRFAILIADAQFYRFTVPRTLRVAMVRVAGVVSAGRVGEWEQSVKRADRITLRPAPPRAALRGRTSWK